MEFCFSCYHNVRVFQTFLCSTRGVNVKTNENYSLAPFTWLISHQPAVLFS
jgi:hypothetical protein